MKCARRPVDLPLVCYETHLRQRRGHWTELGLDLTKKPKEKEKKQYKKVMVKED